VSFPDPATEGHRRAAEYLSLLGTDSAGALLDGLSDIRDLVFLGAGLTAIARAEARFLPPAQRAQANTRQERLGVVRDANRGNPEGLRTWLRQAGEEIALIRSQQAIADQVHGQERAARAAAEANGTTAASSAATTT